MKGSNALEPTLKIQTGVSNVVIITTKGLNSGYCEFYEFNNCH